MDYASVVAKLEALVSDDAATDAERAEAKRRIEAIRKNRADELKPKPRSRWDFFGDSFTDADISRTS